MVSVFCLSHSLVEHSFTEQTTHTHTQHALCLFVFVLMFNWSDTLYFACAGHTYTITVLLADTVAVAAADAVVFFFYFFSHLSFLSPSQFSLSLSLIHLHLSTAWIAFGKSFIGNNLMHKRNILFYFQLTIVCARFAVLLFCFGCNFCYLHFTVVLLLLVVIQLEITSSCKRFKLNWTETQNSEVFVFNGFSNGTNIAWEWYCMSELANMLVIKYSFRMMLADTLQRSFVSILASFTCGLCLGYVQLLCAS